MDMNELSMIYENMLKLQQNLSVNLEILDQMLLRMEAVLPDAEDAQSHNLTPQTKRSHET
jgi:hypothetical protein